MNIQKTLKRLKASDQGGFTLIELLVVIGILAILLAITLIAINPNKHFEDARNAQRQSNVAAILDAIYEYESANGGKEPPSVANVTSTVADLGAQPAVIASSTSFSSPDLTLNVPATNTITSGTVNISGCSQSADNGTGLSVVSGTSITIVVNNPSASATSATGCSISSWSGMVDVCPDLVPTFIAALPTDPSSSSGTACSSTYNTGYTIAQNNGRFTIAAPAAEDGATISVTR